MHQIWAYTLKIRSEQEVEMPEGVEPLCVQIQPAYDGIRMWCRVDAASKKRRRNVYIYGTGQPCDGSLHLQYVGTVQMAQGQFVWHVFMEKTK